MKLIGTLGRCSVHHVPILGQVAVLFLALGTVIPPEAQSCTTWWNVAGSGSWSNGQNWSTGDPPGITDDVCIQLDAQYTVFLDDDVSVRSLVLGTSQGQSTQTLQILSSYSLGVELGVLVHESGSFTMSSDSAVWGSAGSLVQNWGFVGINTSQVDVNFENYGQLQFIGNAWLQQTVTNGSEGSISAVSATAQADLRLETGIANYGSIFLIGNDNLSITIVNGQLENKPGALIQAGLVPPKGGKQGALPPEIIGEIYNQGTIRVQDNGIRLTGDGLSSTNAASGSIRLIYGNVDLDLVGGTKSRAASSFTNLGSIDIGAGLSFDVSTASGKSGSRAASSFTNLGSIDIGAGSSFNVTQSSRTTEAASSFTNLGSIDIGTGGTFRCEGASFANEQNTRGSEGVISGFGLLDLSAAFSIFNNAAIEPGNTTTTGDLSLYGDLAQGSSASLRFDLGGRTEGSYDALRMSSALQKVGSLELSLIGGFVPVAGDSFEILEYQGAEGSYATTTVFPSLGAGLGWELEERSNLTTARVVCSDGDDLHILDVSQDKDPVSVDSVLTIGVLVESKLGNTGVSLRADLGPNLVLNQVDIGDCLWDGVVLDCDLGDLSPSEMQEIVFSVIPTADGDLPLPFTLSGYYCDFDDSDNVWNATVHAIAAAPCDANGDGVMNQYDIPAAVDHFYGVPVSGNPDCSDDGVLDARDLALIATEAGG